MMYRIFEGVHTRTEKWLDRCFRVVDKRRTGGTQQLLWFLLIVPLIILSSIVAGTRWARMKNRVGRRILALPVWSEDRDVPFAEIQGRLSNVSLDDLEDALSYMAGEGKLVYLWENGGSNFLGPGPYLEGSLWRRPC